MNNISDHLEIIYIQEEFKNINEIKVSISASLCPTSVMIWTGL